MPEDTANVPRYFADFVKQNADEHGRLAAEMAATRCDLREEMAALRGDLTAKIEALLGDLRHEITAAEARITRWLIAAGAVGFSVLSTIIILVD